MEIILGFACGIAFNYLLNILIKRQKNKFECGDEDVCKDCKFHQTVINSLDD